jgi:hypothetical protein
MLGFASSIFRACLVPVISPASPASLSLAWSLAIPWSIRALNVSPGAMPVINPLSSIVSRALSRLVTTAEIVA